MKAIDILQKNFGVTIPDELVETFASTLERREYQKGELILEGGAVSRYMHIVETGIIRQFYYKEGRNITEHFSCEGNVATCLESLFLQEPTRLLIEAIEPSVIYLLDYAKLKELTDVYPPINRMLQAILEWKLVLSQQKADSWRFENSHERYERFCKEYPEAAKRASVADIASYLLMAPETLSRVRAGVL